jgi:hypothetical protein
MCHTLEIRHQSSDQSFVKLLIFDPATSEGE